MLTAFYCTIEDIPELLATMTELGWRGYLRERSSTPDFQSKDLANFHKECSVLNKRLLCYNSSINFTPLGVHEHKTNYGRIVYSLQEGIGGPTINLRVIRNLIGVEDYSDLLSVFYISDSDGYLDPSNKSQFIDRSEFDRKLEALNSCLKINTKRIKPMLVQSETKNFITISTYFFIKKSSKAYLNPESWMVPTAYGKCPLSQFIR
ncbi:MAG: hypothetical protein ROR55_20140 [Devosia sp.]